MLLVHVERHKNYMKTTRKNLRKLSTLLVGLTAASAVDQTYKIINGFGDNAIAGVNPQSQLVQAADGTLYGTTIGGGSTGVGTVFEVNPDGASFTASSAMERSSTAHQSTSFGFPEAHPYAGLVLNGSTLYGATANGGGLYSPITTRDQFQTIHIRGESFAFKQGHLENYKADQNSQALPPYLTPHTKDRFGFFRIGLNPKAKVIEDPADYRPNYAAGLVTIGIGDNEIRGGKNRIEGGADFNFPIINATVTMAGNTIAQDGKLCF